MPERSWRYARVALRSRKTQCPQQVRLERVSRGVDRVRPRHVRQPGHLEPFITTWVDPPERLQIEAHVKREPVIARAPTHANPHARELSPIDVHARRAAPSLSRHSVACGQVDDAALERRHEVTYPEPRTA